MVNALSRQLAGLRPKEPDPIGAWVTAGAIALAVVFFYVRIDDLPQDIQRWPTFLSWLAFILLPMYAIQQIYLVGKTRARSRVEGEQAEADDRASEEEEPTAIPAAVASDDALAYGNAADYTRGGDVLTIAAFVGFCLYAAAAWAVGWFLATLLFVTAYVIVAGERTPWKIVTLNITLLVMIQFLFGNILNTNLTRGNWFSPDWLTSWIPF